MKPPYTLLFVHYGENWLRGSERCLIDLILHLDPKRFKPIVWSNNPALAQHLTQYQIQVYLTPFSVLFNHEPASLGAWWQQVRFGCELVDKHHVDLIHANSGAPCQWLNIVARRTQRPLIAHLHARYPFYQRVLFGLYHANVIVGVSQAVIDSLLADGVPASKCQVIVNGIDSQKLLSAPMVDIRSQLGLDADEFLMMSIGSLIERKGMDLLIIACHLLHQMDFKPHLIILGDGAQKAALHALISQYQLEKYVHLLGEQQHCHGYLRAGIQLYVSGAREEVFGLTLAEAGLARLPVVAPRVGGIPEVVIDGKTGLLVEPNSPQALAHAIYQLYLDPAFSQLLGQQGQQRVMQHFEVNAYSHAFETLYLQQINYPNQRSAWYRNWQLMPIFKGGGASLRKLLIKNINQKGMQ